MTVWKQQRPEWCPHRDCVYRASSQDCLCVGELPERTPHYGGFNSHRLCMAQSCPGDDEWLFQLEINDGDAHGISRVLGRVFGFKPVALAAATGTAKTPQAVECEASQSGGEAATPQRHRPMTPTPPKDGGHQ